MFRKTVWFKKDEMLYARVPNSDYYVTINFVINEKSSVFVGQWNVGGYVVAVVCEATNLFAGETSWRRITWTM
jgi:hypothetical protein